MAQDIGPLDRPLLGRLHGVRDVHRAACRSTTPRRRWRSCCATSTSRSRRVKSIDPTIDQGISDWIERLLVKDPTQRTQSANDAWDEFEEIIIGLLGPRWRREARLREGSAQFDTPAPLTPAPFQGTTSDAAVSDEFQSFAWGNAVTPDAPPGPATPPPSQSLPVPPEPVVGPPTPEPGPAVASDGTAPPADQADSGFVTFGAPAAEPEAPEVEAGDPLGAEASAPAPAEVEPPTVEQGDPIAEAPAAEAAQVAEPETEPLEDEAAESFETYIAPRAAAPADRRRAARGARDPGARAGADARARAGCRASPPPRAAAPAPAAARPPRRRRPRSTTTTSRRRSCRRPSRRPSRWRTSRAAREPERQPEPVAEEPKERKSGKGALIGFGIAACSRP